MLAFVTLTRSLFWWKEACDKSLVLSFIGIGQIPVSVLFWAINKGAPEA